MQTRRDQLHAYRFLTKRALAALVTGEPNAVEPPMRRLTLTTISGLMIAVLVGVGFAVFGLIKPSAGDSWKAQGTIIVERETGARYVYLQGRLDPVLNYSSGVLAVSGNGSNTQAKVVLVDRSDIADTPRGPTIGIDGIPDSLPAAAEIVNSPWTVCSRQHRATATTLAAGVSVAIGAGVLRSSPLADGAAVLVNAPSAPTVDYLLWQGKRLRIASEAVVSALHLDETKRLTVGTAFLMSVDAGATLATPTIPGLGNPGPAIDGHSTTVGQLLQAAGSTNYSVVLDDGVQSLTPLQAAVLQTVKAPPELSLAENAIVAAPHSRTQGPALIGRSFTDLPSGLPLQATQPDQLGDVCAVFPANASSPPRFAVVPSTLPSYQVSAVGESAPSRRGLADSVAVSPGHAALVRSADGSPTVFAVAEPGEKFAFAQPDLTAAFGYGASTAAAVPGQLLDLVPTGPALNPTAALTPVSG